MSLRPSKRQLEQIASYFRGLPSAEGSTLMHSSWVDSWDSYRHMAYTSLEQSFLQSLPFRGIPGGSFSGAILDLPLGCPCRFCHLCRWFTDFHYHLPCRKKGNWLSSFQEGRLYEKHTNPDATITTTLKVYSVYSLQDCYIKKNYFWSFSPKANDTINFKFEKPFILKK